jgi:uncharacterized membrane protein
MVIAYLPFLVCIVGLLVWALASNGIAKKAGEWMFVVGLFWTVYSLLGHTVHLG